MTVYECYRCGRIRLPEEIWPEKQMRNLESGASGTIYILFPGVSLEGFLKTALEDGASFRCRAETCDL